MRVANTMVYNMVQSNLQNSTRALNDAAETAITGKRILALSDDPIGLSQSLEIRSGLDGIEQVERGISLGNTWLTASENALTQSQNLITDTKTLAIQMANATISPVERIAAADTVQNTMEELLSLANTKVDDRYLFSGSKTNAPAFTGAATEVRTLEIWGSLDSDVGDPASFSFMGLGNLTLEEGSADLASGADKNAVTEALAELLSDDLGQTTSDFQEATGSNAVITDVSSIDNVLTFTFEGLDVDDTDVINLGFAAKGDTGNLTVNEGTNVPDYKGDSNPFSIKIGDSTVAIGNDGGEIFKNMFESLAALKIALENDYTDVVPDDPNDPHYIPGIQDAMNKLDDDFERLNVAITSVGTKMNRMDIKESIYQDLTLSETARLSDIEDADITEAITNLQQKQLAYQAALSASAKVMELSLLDYV